MIDSDPGMQGDVHYRLEQAVIHRDSLQMRLAYADRALGLLYDYFPPQDFKKNSDETVKYQKLVSATMPDVGLPQPNYDEDEIPIWTFEKRGGLVEVKHHIDVSSPYKKVVSKASIYVPKLPRRKLWEVFPLNRPQPILTLDLAIEEETQKLSSNLNFVTNNKVAYGHNTGGYNRQIVRSDTAIRYPRFFLEEDHRTVIRRSATLENFSETLKEDLTNDPDRVGLDLLVSEFFGLMNILAAAIPDPEAIKSMNEVAIRELQEFFGQETYTTILRRPEE